MSVMVTLTSTPVLVDVRVEMNDHETITAELHKTNGTRHLMTYESERVRDALASLFEGARVPVEMVCADSRSSVWEVVALHGR